jgi:YVTN family beta-propeller protein
MTLRVNLGHAAALSVVAVMAAPVAAAQAAPYVYVANADSNNVSQYSTDSAGSLTPLSPATVAAGSSPRDVVVSPDGKSVYVTNHDSGTISQYDVATDGTLAPKSPAAVDAGDDPAAIAIHPDSDHIYVTHFGSPGYILIYDVRANGTLDLSVSVPASAEGITFSPDGRSAYVAGGEDDPSDPLTGGVLQYDVGSDGGLTPKTPASVTAPYGEFPRSVALSPDGKNAYVASRPWRGFGSRIAEYQVGASGQLLPESDPPTVSMAANGGDVAVSPDGASVYAATSANLSFEIPSHGDVAQFDRGPDGHLAAKTPPVALGSPARNASGIEVNPNTGSAYVTTGSCGYGGEDGPLCQATEPGLYQYAVGEGGGLSAMNPVNVPTGEEPRGLAMTPTVGTSVSVSGTSLVIRAPFDAKDNFKVARPAPGLLRVTNFAQGAYSGSAVLAGAGCTQAGENGAECEAGPVSRIRLLARDRGDKVVNLTGIPSSLRGGLGSDILLGGWNSDTLTGGSGADSLKGLNGDDLLNGVDGTADTRMKCDGGSDPGRADQADLDRRLDSRFSGCELVRRH